LTKSATAKQMRLTNKAVAQGAAELAKRDPALRTIHRLLGPPPLLRRPATFGTFVHIILEQQVSVESAKATFDRLRKVCVDGVSPESVLRLGEQRLGELGFSRQKRSYALALAADTLEGRFRIGNLARLDDETVRRQIIARKGLGNWSADVFMMMALLRPDVLPVGDLALVKGLSEIDGAEYKSVDSITRRAESRRPRRSIATRMVWQWYVHRRGRDIF
jgi:DNA-3-methyladenine glycosylase II